MSEPDSLRAADVDREFVAQRLRDALNEGRLTLTEYDDRLREAYAARTYGELKTLLNDLPQAAPAERSTMVPASPSTLAQTTPAPVIPRNHTRTWLAGMWSSWLSVSLICVAVWFASGMHGDFWPIWVIGPWGAILLASTITGLARGEPRRQAERDARRRAERDARRAQRDAEREAERGEPNN